MKKFFSWKIIAILVATLLIAIFDAPNGIQDKIPYFPEAVKSLKVNLGLDLQGGSQLDYKVDLRSVPEKDRDGIVSGVTEVINKRVNGLGVSEPNIYTSKIGDEAHIIVELADLTAMTNADVAQYLKSTTPLDQLTDDEKKTLSLEKAKATVGKTIQLEFKEEKTTIDPQEKEKIKNDAQAALNKIKGGTSFQVVGQEESLAYPGRVIYETVDYKFKDELNPKLQDVVTKLNVGEYTKSLIEVGGSFTLSQDGQAVEATSLDMIKLLDKKEEVKSEKQVEASHVLVAYKGASNAAETVIRTEEEAYTYAQEALTKLKAGKSFADVTKFYSDDPSNKDAGGKLSKPVTGDNTYVSDFEKAALALEKDGDISEITKTEFGYHIIKADKISSDVKETKYKYESISYSTVPDPWKATNLTGKNFVHADVQVDQFFNPYISIEFDDEGAKLFEEITGRNVGKPVAIFVGGNLISDPKVNEKIAGGKAQITGKFSQEEANNIARDLNTGAIPAPIVLAGEYTIGATLGQNALQVSIWAGLIGFLAICAFMIIVYRVQGLFASIALGIYAVILLLMIKAELGLGLALLTSLIILGALIYKIINSKDATGEKVLSFLLSCIIFYFLTAMLQTAIVITLAGIAGIILSIGMAVDANVLIFERIREELHAGRPFNSAVEEGFFRAWSSIRDSNFSTLITCGILFYLGSSTIRGFAFNLAAGILISMFTAITITRTFLLAYGKTERAKDLRTMGVNVDKPKIHTTFKFIKNAKKWFAGSAVMLLISVGAMATLGFRPGIDFTGGTLMEVKFDKEITKEVLATSLIEIGDKLGTTQTASAAEGQRNEPSSPSTTSPSTPDSIMLSKTPEAVSADELVPLDLKNIQIVPSGVNSYLIKSKYLTSVSHDKIIAELKAKRGNLTELRFTTVGPTVGETLKNKAIIAIIVTILAIILYVAFAFRKVTKEVSPWKFGACAIIALIHDVTIVTGMYVILGAIIGFESDALLITALLTILGYSVNDTIVVFDRLRENLKMAGKDETLENITDRAINQTLTRSIYTGLTVLIAVLALFIGTFFGGGAESIRYFLFALLVGLVIGTYSSIFIASSGLIVWTRWENKRNEKKLAAQK